MQGKLLRRLTLACLLGMGSAAQAELLSGDVWLGHVKNDLLPFWASPDALGLPPGNFPTFRCNDGKLPNPAALCPELANPPAWIRPEVKRTYVRMQGRQTYAYAVAFHLTGDKRWLDAAKAGAAHTLSVMGAEGGAPSWFENGKPQPAENARPSQDQSYAVVGLAMLYYLTRDPALEKALVAHEQYVFKHYWDKDWGMLRWVPADGPADEASRQELVAQLDQLNAYMILVAPYLSDKARKPWLEDIRKLSKVIIDKYYDPASGTFFGTLDKANSRAPGSRHNDFGHTIKSYWMLMLAGEELGDAQLQAFARDGAAKILPRAWDAESQAWGSAWKTDGIERNKSWWIFAELDQMAATLSQTDRKHVKYLETSWPFWLNKLTDHTNGEVWGGASAAGVTNPASLKIHLWKNGFHSFEHALMSYLIAQGLAGKPATLYFATPNDKSLFKPYLLQGEVSEVRKRADGEGVVEEVQFRISAPVERAP